MRGKPKGLPKTGGRQKGTPNKLTTSAKEAIEQAFDGIGGVEALKTWARLNQNIFYGTVWPKIIPHTVAGDKDNPIELIVRTCQGDLGAKLDRLADTATASKAKG